MKVTIQVDLGDDAAEVHAMVDRIMGDATADKKKPAKKAAAKKADEEAPPADDGPTRDEVRNKLKEYAALEGKDEAIKILKDNGAASIGELDEEKFAAVIEACG